MNRVNFLSFSNNYIVDRELYHNLFEESEALNFDEESSTSTTAFDSFLHIDRSNLYSSKAEVQVCGRLVSSLILLHPIRLYTWSGLFEMPWSLCFISIMSTIS